LLLKVDVEGYFAVDASDLTTRVICGRSLVSQLLLLLHHPNKIKPAAHSYHATQRIPVMIIEYKNEASNEPFPFPFQLAIWLATQRAYSDFGKAKYVAGFGRHSYTLRVALRCGVGRAAQPLKDTHFEMPTLSFVIPLPERVAECTWSKRPPVFDSTLYINPDLLTRYQNGGPETNLACIVYCIVLNEFDHLLKSRIDNEQPAMSNNRLHVPHEVGVEAQFQLLGGQVLSRGDFSELRIQTRSGDIYSLDPDYLYGRITAPTSCAELDFERLRKVGRCKWGLPPGWMGMEEINGTHN
jgi:hypothetical protein